MIDFDFILHYTSYSVPLFWCGTVLYIYIKRTKLLQRSTIFYFVLIILYGSSQLLVWAWAELDLSTSGMGLGRAQTLNFWYGLGPSSTCLFVRKGMGYPFCGPISYFNFTTSKSVTGLTLQSSMVKCENNQATSLKLKAPTNISYLVLEPPKQSSQIMDLTLVASPKSSKVSS